MLENRDGVRVLIYCTAADGEKYGCFGTTAGLHRDEFVWLFLQSIEADGDTVNSIYIIPGNPTADELRRLAESKPPAFAILAYSPKVRYLRDRGHRPDRSRCLSLDALQ